MRGWRVSSSTRPRNERFADRALSANIGRPASEFDSLSFFFQRRKAQQERRPAVQYAVLPYRTDGAGKVEVMLLTSRETKRWVIPKGWPITGLEPHLSAAREAYEEAGLIGFPSPQAIGYYDYGKRMKGGKIVPARVEVFPLAVQTQLETWPEYHERETRWFSIEEAAGSVHEGGLANLILALGSLVSESRS